MDHWEKVRLEDVTIKVGSGSTPRGGSKAYKNSGIPLIRSMNVHFDGLHADGLAFIDDEQAKRLRNAEVRSADVLLNITGASIGRVTQATDAMDGARVNQHVCIIRPQKQLNSTFLSRYLASPTIQRMIWSEEYGVTRQALTKQGILDFEIPLPPLNEQHRIVTKIEALTTRSRKAREALDAIPALLDQFRQSVLAAAFRGDLTADWRAQNPDVEPAEKLLERLSERKNLSNSKLSKKPPKRPEDITEISFDCPQEWGIAQSHDLFTFVTSGSRGWAKYYSDEGSLFVRVGNLDRNTISLDLTDVQNVNPPEGVEGTRTKIQGGDILVSITADVGMIALVDNDIREAYINQHVALARPISGFSRKYVAWYLASYNDGFQQFKSLQRGATKTGLGLGDIRSILIPFPSVKEQQEIVEAIELSLAAISKMESQYLSVIEKFSQLDQSILAKAFRGQLVPQDPTDEPASVLLQRIQAEREKLNAKTKKKKTRAKKKK